MFGLFLLVFSVFLLLADTMFLTYTVFRFILNKDVILPRFTGGIVLSLVLNLISIVDEELARKLHESKAVKPYSVSPFMSGGRVIFPPKSSFTHLYAGRMYSFRACFIGGLARTILEAFSILPEGSVKLMNADMYISEVEVKSLSFREIKPVEASGEGDVKVVFLTPTRFAVRRSKPMRKPKFSLFPAPERLFHSIVHHWNSFAGDRVSEQKFIDWVIDNVYEVDYHTRSCSVDIGKGRKAVGFTGYVIYRIEGSKSKRDFALKLLRYAEYVNVGNAKSMGLGVVRIEKPVK
ncbi:MAG: CRISPR-associated endoribonuclease Cas6 [Thermoprotei archaeon]|nr:MAG: CRISPR-associated endoribonuclease Cas6 [Thermoprotei archaeon]